MEMHFSARPMSLLHAFFTNAPPLQETGSRQSAWEKLLTRYFSTTPNYAVRAATSARP
jgi:hypothetical protein